ncbi:MarR family winged helix-turn-helix transcriptional regulator [Antrihabitans cavernicola]|uniref:MarR family transcriptional regulator n=1 Tax=Antrihabitans cavernicola TaxID=2495913 RepID=A0A5A7SG28_9NOCA|nr:MarR family transcriptional regulator [Spelaeibacter cavernicola]KAA0023583.1 MarR family transcriptional regulator [Spelaeibacter cavernicola]
MTENDRVETVVAQWQRERPDLQTEAMALFGRLGRLALLAEEAINSTFVRNGLQRGEFDVLAALRRSGAPYELNPSVLAEQLMLSRAGMTGRLDRLESAGLVQRIADAGDRRSIRVVLTDDGKTLIDRVVAEHVDNEEGLIESLTKHDRAELDRLVRKLSAAMGRRERPGGAS